MISTRKIVFLAFFLAMTLELGGCAQAPVLTDVQPGEKVGLVIAFGDDVVLEDVGFTIMTSNRAEKKMSDWRIVDAVIDVCRDVFGKKGYEVEVFESMGHTRAPTVNSLAKGQEIDPVYLARIVSEARSNGINKVVIVAEGGMMGDFIMKTRTHLRGYGVYYHQRNTFAYVVTQFYLVDTQSGTAGPVAFFWKYEPLGSRLTEDEKRAIEDKYKLAMKNADVDREAGLRQDMLFELNAPHHVFDDFDGLDSSIKDDLGERIKRLLRQGIEEKLQQNLPQQS